MSFDQEQKLSTIIAAVLLAVALLIPAIGFPFMAYGQPPEQGVQDVLLIVDNSGSMFKEVYPHKANDPEGWRFVAGAVVVNYLAVAADPSITYRMTLISYAREAVTIAGPSELGEAYRADLTRMLDPDNPTIGNIHQGFTNPHWALKRVLEELEEHPNPNPVRPPIVIILTDGDFEDNSIGLSPEEYAKKVESAVLDLKERGAVVHAVLLGEKARGNKPEWERLTDLTGGQVLLVDEAEELPAAYIQLVRTIVGTVSAGAPQKETAPAEKVVSQAIGISLDDNEIPYVDSLVVTVWQTRKDFSVSFVRPDGRVLVPIPGEVERRGSDYVVVWRIKGADLVSGGWETRLGGGSKEGNVQIFVDYIPLRLTLLTPFTVAPQGQSVTLEALLEDRDGFPFDATEALEVQMEIYREQQEVSSERMSLISEGGQKRLSLKYTFNEAGVYDIELLPRLHLKGGGTRSLQPPKGQRWTVKVAKQPIIRDVRLEPSGEAEVGEPIRLIVTVGHTEAQRELSVLALMRESDSGRTVWEERLRPSPGGMFEGGPFSLEKAGRYTLEVNLRGEALVPGEEIWFRYGPDTPNSIQQTMEYTVRVPPFQIGDVQVGEKGRTPRGQKTTIQVQVLLPEGASVKEVEAIIEGGEPVSLHDDGQPPDERRGDGVFSGVLPPLAEAGIHQVEVQAKGQSVYKAPLFTRTEVPLVVELPWWENPRVIGGGIGLAILLAGVLKWWREKQKAPLTGTLHITYPPDQRGRRWILDELFLKKANIGIEAGHIALPALGKGVSTGVKAELFGRWEKSEWEGKKIAVYIRPKGRDGILVGGIPPEGTVRLLDGTTIEVGGITLEYLLPVD